MRNLSSPTHHFGNFRKYKTHNGPVSSFCIYVCVCVKIKLDTYTSVQSTLWVWPMIFEFFSPDEWNVSKTTSNKKRAITNKIIMLIIVYIGVLRAVIILYSHITMHNYTLQHNICRKFALNISDHIIFFESISFLLFRPGWWPLLQNSVLAWLVRV